MKEELEFYSDKIMKLDLKTQIKAKVACARLVQNLMKDKRSLDALDVCDRFVEGKASRKELDEAAYGVYDAAYDAAYVAVYVAVYAAASAAYYAAAYAAYDAASAYEDTSVYDDIYDAVYTATSNDIIKKCILIFKEILREEKINNLLDGK